MSARTPSELLNDLVDAHWETAARHAWRQYQQRGRGAIVFPIDPEGADGRRPLRYLTFTDDDAAREGAFSMLHELVTSYDPERQIVMAIELDDDRTVFDVYEQSPPPPDA